MATRRKTKKSTARTEGCPSGKVQKQIKTKDGVRTFCATARRSSRRG
jgi:hypothetical protein